MSIGLRFTKISLGFFILLFGSGFMFCQSPYRMSYQAVVRNSNNQLLVSHPVGIKISILQHAPDGNIVFQETFEPIPKTNENGLVSLEIGGGTSLFGSFTVINWADGPFFLKTEIDTGGANDYNLETISQLLSVPYAFFAQTAGAFSENDPSWDGEANPDSPIGREGRVGIGIIHPEETLDIDGQIKIRGGDPGIGKVLTSDAEGKASWEQGKIKYKIGDFAFGGIVFWVDESGEHGLVCAKEDLGPGIRWYAGTIGSTQAKGDGPLAGRQNTAIIIAAHIAIGDDGSTYAARICNTFKVTEGGITYADWYLPSVGELALMFENRLRINETALLNGGTAFQPSYYWSSTESYNAHAFYLSFGSGLSSSSNKALTYLIRAVRSF